MRFLYLTLAICLWSETSLHFRNSRFISKTWDDVTELSRIQAYFSAFYVTLHTENFGLPFREGNGAG